MGWLAGLPTAIANSAAHSIGSVCSLNNVITINQLTVKMMANKQDAMNAVNRAIGFIYANAPSDVRGTLIHELRSSLSFIEDLEKSEVANEMKFVINCEGIDEDAISKFKAAFAAGLRDQKTLFVGEWALPNEPLKTEAIKQIIEEIDNLPKKMNAPEEAGWVVDNKANELKAAIYRHILHRGSLEDVRRTAAQLGAVAVKVLMNIPCSYRDRETIAGAPRNG
ncbi:hypothetical protein HKQ57_05475 [Serratia marcescens]|uniref:hypothetical protein n=2 Tax=Serratia marcescens TaxID=615 RepID=UPI00155FBB25|nr:hypothetical protein [Serratia marcescens]NRN54561.1 hypothetical protein [Serratia marcescens]